MGVERGSVCVLGEGQVYRREKVQKLSQVYVSGGEGAAALGGGAWVNSAIL